MSILLLFLLAFSRPDCPPVTAADIERALALESAGFGVSAEYDLADRSDWSAMKDRIPGRFVAGFEPGRLEELLDRLSVMGGFPVRVDSAAGFVVCSMPDAAGLALAGQPLPAGARWFEPDARTRIAHIPNDPFFLSEQWDKWVMYADRAWDITRGSTDITIAICDNGVDYTHPDLAARFTPGRYGYDFVDNDDDPKPNNITIPESFHGTHVAGITAATMDNSVGIAGWAGARLLALKVLNDSGSGTMTALASGIRWAVDNGARVINMSLGSNDYSRPVAEAAGYAAARNVLLVAASGNAGTGLVQYPARLPEVVCVGSIDRDGALANYSNYGVHQDLVAPGSQVLSLRPGADFGYASGTSMAAPQVAGVAGLVMAVNQGLSASRVRAILTTSAVDMEPSGRDDLHGYGLANAYRAVRLAGMMTDGVEPARLVESSGSFVIAGNWQVPDWVEELRVYDITGRNVPVSGRELALPSGIWFARIVGQGRSELVRLSVLR